MVAHIQDNNQQFSPSPGAIVRCRQRQWVVLPNHQADIVRLRPLSGFEEESCGIYLPLEPELEPADFPLPSVQTLQDFSAVCLLQDATRALAQVHNTWDRAVEREKQNRTRFAQRSIKPDEVERELLESEEILGNEDDVERFVLTACNRLGTALVKKKQGWYLPQIPPCVHYLGDKPRLIGFTTPTPEGVEYIGRNHPLVEGLARYLFEEALENLETPTAARCGVTVTDAVTKPTVILLLRLRHLLENRKQGNLLAEECLVQGFTGLPSNPQWLSSEEILTLISSVQPTGDLTPEQKRSRIEMILGAMEQLQPELEKIARQRSQTLADSHQRVRAMTKEGKVTVVPKLPMDILGIYYLISR